MEIMIKAAGTIIAAVPGWQERRLPDVELRIQMKAAPFRLTCTEIEVCRNGAWVRGKRRFTLERTGPDRSGGRRDLGGGHTWDQAQALIRRFAEGFSRRQRRALERMRTFQQECESGCAARPSGGGRCRPASGRSGAPFSGHVRCPHPFAGDSARSRDPT